MDEFPVLVERDAHGGLLATLWESGRPAAFALERVRQRGKAISKVQRRDLITAWRLGW